MERDDTRSILIIGVIGVALSIFLLWGARSVKKEVERFENEGIIVRATILDKRQATRGTYRVEYEYYVDGRRYSPRNYETVYEKDVYDSIGSEADVYYLPDDPSQSNLVGNKQNSFDLLYGAGLTMGLSGMLVFGMQIPPRIRRTPLAKLMLNARYIVGIASAIIVLIPIVPFDSRPETIWSMICLSIPIVISLAVAYSYTNHRIEVGREIQKSLRREWEDISFKNVQCPQGMYSFERTLLLMGFKQLGETDRADPDPEDKTVTWYFNNRDFSTLAEVVYEPEIAQFSSWFGEDRRVETSFPIGENVDTPYLRSRFTEESLDAAYQMHIESCEEFTNAFGQPILITSINEVIKWEKLYMSRYYRRKTQRLVTVSNLRVVYGVYLILFTLGLFLAYYTFERSSLWAYYVIGMALIYPFNAAPGWVMNYRRYPIQFRLLEAEEQKSKAVTTQLSESSSLEKMYEESEIAANRAGQLTDKQIDTLKWISGIDSFPFFMFMLGYVLIGIFAIWTIATLFGNGSSDSTDNRTILLIVCIMATLGNTYYTVRAIRKRKTFKKRLKTETVLSLKSVSKRHFIRRENPDDVADYWYEYMGDPLIQIVEQYDSMDDNSTYNVYYWSHIFDDDEWDDYRWVLSIEKNND